LRSTSAADWVDTEHHLTITSLATCAAGWCRVLFNQKRIAQPNTETI
jgi:hypothetical protein